MALFASLSRRQCKASKLVVFDMKMTSEINYLSVSTVEDYLYCFIVSFCPFFDVSIRMMELLKRRYAVIDTEAIMINSDRNLSKGKFSKRHHCTRKICFEFWDNSTQSLEFQQCVSWQDLDNAERRSFSYCKKIFTV